jgi:hypothetical protein
MNELHREMTQHRRVARRFLVVSRLTTTAGFLCMPVLFMFMLLFAWPTWLAFFAPITAFCLVGTGIGAKQQTDKEKAEDRKIIWSPKVLHQTEHELLSEGYWKIFPHEDHCDRCTTRRQTQNDLPARVRDAINRAIRQRKSLGARAKPGRQTFQVSGDNGESYMMNWTKYWDGTKWVKFPEHRRKANRETVAFSETTSSLQQWEDESEEENLSIREAFGMPLERAQPRKKRPKRQNTGGWD